MASERQANREYYYRSLRDGSPVIKQYIGCGQRALEAAEADQVIRSALRLESLRRAEQTRPIRELAGRLDEFDTLLNPFVAFRLVSAGWKRHHDQWIVRKP